MFIGSSQSGKLAVHRGFIVAALLQGTLHCSASAGDRQVFPFADGIWTGGVEDGSASGAPVVCWASTTFKDSTTLALLVRGSKNWQLRISNPNWKLSAPRRYDLVAQVDFYPRVLVSAESKSQEVLEFEEIERVSLVGLIEIGHTIAFSSDEFNAKYDLEGSAKVIERLRGCSHN